jgi:hypothetical protein
VVVAPPRGRVGASRDTVILVVSACVVLIATAGVPQGVMGDQAEQLRAMQQFVAGISPSLNQLVSPDAADLSRDHAYWIVWWPPGVQMLAYPFRAIGLSVAQCARAIAALSLLFGSWGWLRWMRLFELPPRLRMVAAAALPLLHMANATLFFFSSDVLNFAITPWLLLAVHGLAVETVAGHRTPAYRWLVTGFALGMSYVVKYSLLLSALGALAFLVFVATPYWRRDGGRVALALAGCALPVIVLSALNARFAGTLNSLAQDSHLNPRWQHVVALIANPALAAADANGLFRYLFMHPGHAVTDNDLAPAYAGFAGGLVILWLIIHAVRAPELWRAITVRLTITVFVVTLALMGTVWTLSPYAADYDARHVAPASIALLPLLFLSGRDLWRRRGWRTRVVLGLAATICVVVPTMYGAVAVAGKIGRVPAGYRTGPSGFNNPLLAERDLAAVEDRILGGYGASTDVWWIADAVTAFDIPGRALAPANADFTPIERLRAVRYRSSKRLRLTALMPATFEANAKGPTIRGSFVGARQWRRDTVPGSKYDVWTTVIEPTVSAAP